MLESLFNKETLTQVFLCEYHEILKNNYFEEHLRTARSEAKSLRFLLFNKRISVEQRKVLE